MRQLEEPPTRVMDSEAWALRRLAPGPGNWISAADLRHLKSFGIPFDFPSFFHLKLASRMRVLQYEPQINWHALSDRLAEALSTASVSRPGWRLWYETSHVRVVLGSKALVEGMGVSARLVRTLLLGSPARFRTAAQAESHVRKSFQAAVVKQLLRADAYRHEHELRRRLQRWSIRCVPEGILARRAVNILQSSFDLVPNRVAVVFFRTLFNGWCTARRFQIADARCLFGCAYGKQEGCYDSIEHYAHCSIVEAFATQVMHLPSDTVGGMLNFLSLDRGVADDTRTLQLLLLYAVYAATNCIRFASPSLRSQDVHEFLLQYVPQGASGCVSTQKVVNQFMRRNVRRRLTYLQGNDRNQGTRATGHTQQSTAAPRVLCADLLATRLQPCAASSAPAPPHEPVRSSLGPWLASGLN